MCRFHGMAKLARLSLPFAIGLGAGFAFSFWLSLRGQEQCGGSPAGIASPELQSTLVAAGVADDSAYRDDQYEPRLVSASLRKKHENPPSSAPVRTRYASIELDIKETTLVGVLTSKHTMKTRAVALNRTLAHVVPKLLFFALGSGKGAPKELPLVTLPSSTVKSLPLKAIKYMAENHGGQYSFFVLLSDVAYVRGRKLLEFLRGSNVNDDTYAGAPSATNGNYCNFTTGVVLSRAIVMKMASQYYEQCISAEGSLKSFTDIVGHCVLLASNVPCSPRIGEHTYTVMTIPYGANMEGLSERPEFNSSLVYYPVSTETEVYQLHRSVCGVELSETYAALRAAKEEIITNSHMSNGSVVPSWPIGLSQSSRVSSRFDVIQWTYFTVEGFYFLSDANNFRIMDESERADINQMVNLAMQELNRNTNVIRYVYLVLLNGYHRFEPARGQEYILDLLVNDTWTGVNVTRRIEIVKPLTLAEIYRMPPIRAAVAINVVLPLQFSTDVSATLPWFLDSYEKACLTSREKLCKLFAVIVSAGKKDSEDNKKHQPIEDVLRAKIGTSSLEILHLSEIETPADLGFLAARAVSAQLPADSLLLTVTVNTRLDADFLAAVRQYTIKGSQVYVPVGFWEYKPEFVYGKERTRPDVPSIVKEHGHFDSDSEEHVAFFNDDFQIAERTARLNGITCEGISETFSASNDVFLFRAIEPLLKIRHTDIACPSSLSQRRLEVCLKRRAFSVADKSKLATLVLEKSSFGGA